MYSLFALDNWLEAVKTELEEDMTSTKHFHHIKAIETQIIG
jgi:hypothetical protein